MWTIRAFPSVSRFHAAGGRIFACTTFSPTLVRQARLPIHPGLTPQSRPLSHVIFQRAFSPPELPRASCFLPGLVRRVLTQQSSIHSGFPSPWFSCLKAPNQQRNVWNAVASQFRLSQRRMVRTNWYQPTNAKSTGSGGSWSNFGRNADKYLNSQNVIYGLIGINVAVFLLWQYAVGNAKAYGDQRLYQFLSNNFLVGYENVFVHKRWWTMLTANFSHNELWHMFVNMFVLYSFGPPVIDIIGPRQFIFLYVAAGLASSVASLLHSTMSTRRNAWGVPKRQFTATHGASGAITGCTILFAATYPTVPVYLFMVIPIPAAVAIGGFVAYDIYRSYTGSSGRTDSAAHIGGAAAGLAYWYFKVRGRYRGGRW